MENKEIDFVAKHWRPGKFQTNEGWKRLGIAPTGWSLFKRIRVAAAVAGIVAITAVAGVVWRQHSVAPQAQPSQTEQVAAPAIEAVRIIDFDSAPLPTVVAKIREVYGVEVVGVPDNAEEYCLTLHYEGNVADLVEAINDILGTEMEVEQ